MTRPPSSPLAEKLGVLNLPKGGIGIKIAIDAANVRKARKGQYQGYTTAAFYQPAEAAAAIQLGLVDEVERKPRAANGVCNMRMRARPTARPRHLI